MINSYKDDLQEHVNLVKKEIEEIKYEWKDIEKELLNEKKLFFTNKEKEKINILLLKPINNEIRRKVNFFIILNSYG